MAGGNDPGPGSAGRDLVVTRVFDAPRDLLFAAWTRCEHLERWWGPEDFTMPYCDVDLREGGVFLRCMRSPDGRDTWVTGAFREVVVPERLVFTDSFADPEGNVVPAEHYGLEPGLPLERLVTVTFDELAGSTRVTVRHSGLPPGAAHALTRRGWSEGLGSLAEYLKTG